MKILFKKNNDFALFNKSLQHLLTVRQRSTIEIGNKKQAAVNIVLMNKNNEPHVLLTKRTHKVSTHKGQISFPGGMRDASDSDIIYTAQRETHEEVGIPSGKMQIIGIFDDYLSIHDVHITTVISSVNYPCVYTINRDEIEENIEAPLALFINQEYDELRYITWKGTERELYFYHFQGHEIWGLTARILTDLGKVILETDEMYELYATR